MTTMNVHEETISVYEKMLKDRNRPSDIKAGIRVVLTVMPIGYYSTPGYPLYGSEFSTSGIVKSVKGDSALVMWDKRCHNIHLLDHLAAFHDATNVKVNPNHAFHARKRRYGDKT